MANNKEYAIDQSLGSDIQGGGSNQYYPSLQPSCYQPKATDKLELVLAEKSLALLSKEAQALLVTGTMQTAFSDDSEIQTVSVISPSVRWIFLGLPTALFVRHKETKKIQPLASGMSFKRDNLESFGKLFLAAEINDQLVRKADGSIQVFTLALNSTKMDLIENSKDPEYRSVRKLNNWLIKKFPTLDADKFWVHLASVPLVANPTKLTNKEGKTSISALYTIADMPKILHPDSQKEVAFVANSPEMKILVNDPFLLSDKNRATLTQLQAANDSVVEEDDSEETQYSDDF
jgi:hypothetical protein